MKALATVIGIAGLLLAPAAASVDFTWDNGGGNDNAWSTVANWDVGTGYPSGSGDTATIDYSQTPANWPRLDQDYTSAGSDDIGALTMGDDADLDVVSYTLECSVFTVNTNADMTISGSTGKVYPTSIVINGGTTVTVLGGKIETR